jgi:hypothetical protein
MKIITVKKAFCVILLIACLDGFSQNDLGDMEEKNEKEKLSFFDKNAFFIVRLGWDGGNTPSTSYSRPIYPNPFDPDPNIPITMETGRLYTSWVSIVSIGFDSRLNLVNFADKASLSIANAMDFSFPSITYVEHYDLNEAGMGLGTFSTGFFADLNFLNHATYNNSNKNGFTMGFGMRGYLAPLIPIDGPPEGFEYKKVVFGPSVRLIFKRDNNDRNMAYYLEVGIPENGIDIGGFEAANVFIRLQLGWILGY